MPPELKGDVVECGCYLGGSSVNISLVCALTGRRLLIYDSFEGLPEPSGASSDSCTSNYIQHGLMVSARKGDDYSFVLTSWGQGIQPYDFELPYGYSAPGPTFHTILDRTLLRAGETVHMKHVYRQPTPTGFRSGGRVTGTLVMSHQGSGTSFELPLTLGADGIGETGKTTIIARSAPPSRRATGPA